MEPQHPTAGSTEERLRLVIAHRIRLTERQNILKRELRQRVAELTAVEETLEQVIATENRLLREHHKAANLGKRPPAG